jgi:tetratricopeptide (TPR) repeat protein
MISALCTFPLFFALPIPSPAQQVEGLPTGFRTDAVPLSAGAAPFDFAPAPRTAAAEDRAHALALFAEGRLLARKNQLPEALRSYQRAWHWNPQAHQILEEIVPLAFFLGRHGEAVRYAVIAAEAQPPNEALARNLARYLTQEGDFPRALRMYDSAIELAKMEAVSSLLQLHAERLELCFVSGQHRAGVTSADFVTSAAALTPPADTTEEETDLNLPFLLHLAGEVYLETGQWEQARRCFKLTANGNDHDPLFAFNQARIQHQLGQQQRASELLNVYFQSRVQTAGTAPYDLLRHILAVPDAGQNPDHELRRRLEDLYARDTTNRPLAEYLADEYIRHERLSDARIILENLLADQSDPHLLRRLTGVYHRLDQPGPLLALVGQMTEETLDLSGLEEKASALWQDHHFMRHLVAEGRRRLEDDQRPMLSGEALGLALLCLNTGKGQEAEDFFAHALRNAHPDRRLELLMTWGLECLANDDNGRAGDAFEQAAALIQDGEDRSTLLGYLAATRELAGRTDEAVDTIDKALQADPNSYTLHSRLAWIFYHARRYREAEDAYRDLIRRFDADFSSDELRAGLQQARLILATLATKRGDLSWTEEWLAQVLDEFPEDPGARNDLGYHWVEQGKHLARSLRMIQQAVDEDPGNPAFRDSLGWALFQLEQYEQAAQHLEMAIRGSDKPHGIVLDHLGDAYFRLGRTRDAVSAWKQALEALRESDEEINTDGITAKIKAHGAED